MTFAPVSSRDGARTAFFIRGWPTRRGLAERRQSCPGRTRFLRFAARGSDGDLVALFASDDVSTFQREESDRNVVAAAASDYVSTFHADHVVGGRRSPDLGACGLATRGNDGRLDTPESGSVWAPGGRRSTARPRIVLTCRSLSFRLRRRRAGLTPRDRSSRPVRWDISRHSPTVPPVIRTNRR